MNATTIKADLERHSRDTGIRVPELRRICLRAGLELLERGELKVRDPRAKLPIYLPADDVRFLREMCEAAEVGSEGADDLVATVIRDTIHDSPRKDYAGCIEELILGFWLFEPEGEEERAKIAMEAVVEKWRAKESVTEAECG